MKKFKGYGGSDVYIRTKEIIAMLDEEDNYGIKLNRLVCARLSSGESVKLDFSEKKRILSLINGD